MVTTVLAISFGSEDDLRCCVGFSAALWGTPITHFHKLSSVSYHTRARLPRATPQRRTNRMDHQVHQEHAHQHGKKCGHTALMHDGHSCFLHDGHMHFVHGDHVDEHKLDVNSKNPSKCSGGHSCGGHQLRHQHGRGRGPEDVPPSHPTGPPLPRPLPHLSPGQCANPGPIVLAV